MKFTYIEVWRHPDNDEKWIATAQGDVGSYTMSSDYPLAYFSPQRWEYLFKFEGRTYIATVVSHEPFTREESLNIAALIIEGKGLKKWQVDLTEI